MNILDQIHWTNGFVPVADAWDDSGGAVTTDVVEVRSAVGLFALIHKGAGATGTFLVTALACDDATPTTTAAVAFWYRVCTTFDTWGAWTHATTAGFTSTAGANQMYQIFVPAAEVAANGYGYCQLSFTEPVDNPCTGGVALGVIQTRYQDTTTTMLT